jgi:hypothetical protein
MDSNNQNRIINAYTCNICGSPADLVNGAFYECQQNKNHLGDTFVGIFSDLTYPQNPQSNKNSGETHEYK